MLLLSLQMNAKKYLTNCRLIKLLVLMALFFILVTACHNSENQLSNTSMQRAETIAECRVVEHSLGETCMPVHPQRIIAVETVFLDSLFALGFKKSVIGTICYPIPYASEECFPFGVPSDQLKDVESIGSYPPSLEKILLLKPDLILGLDWMEPTYEQLSNIAPTVLLHWSDDWNLSFKTYFRHIAQVTGREDVAEEVISQYQTQISEVKRQLGDRLKNVEVSAVLYGHAGNKEFSVPPRYAIWFQILDDLGIKIKPIFSMQRDWSSSLSIELINNYDSDILFIFNSFSKSLNFFNEPVNSLLEKPLVATLKAVKNKRAYVIDGQDTFDVYGPSGVNRLLELLSRHLLEAAETF
ncbi:MAG: ABC transporter substrate-binding protein [Nodosilinea sp.]